MAQQISSNVLRNIADYLDLLNNDFFNNGRHPTSRHVMVHYDTDTSEEHYQVYEMDVTAGWFAMLE